MSPVIGCARHLDGHPPSIENLPLHYAWLEAPLDVCLTRLPDVPNWQDLGLWPAGRVFGQSGEYRWQRNSDGSLHGVLLLDHGALPPEFTETVELQSEGVSNLLLWGKWVDPKRDPDGSPDGGPRFYASEIPRVQTYPIDLTDAPNDSQSPWLVIHRYRAVNRIDGEFLRCVGFGLRARKEE